jgi:hypothetical protein
LKNAIRYHSVEVITAGFKVAAMLHNMLLAYNHVLEEFGPDLEAAFTNLDPNNHGIDVEVEAAEVARTVFEDNTTLLSFPVISGVEGAAILENIILAREPLVLSETSLDFFTNAMVDSFSFQYQIGQIWWPRTRRFVNLERGM